MRIQRSFKPAMSSTKRLSPSLQTSARGDFLKFYALARSKAENKLPTFDAPATEDFAARVIANADDIAVWVNDLDLINEVWEPLPRWMDPETNGAAQQKVLLGELLYALRLYCNPKMGLSAPRPHWHFTGHALFPELDPPTTVALRQGLDASRFILTVSDRDALVAYELAERLPAHLVLNLGPDEWAGFYEANVKRTALALPEVANVFFQQKDFQVGSGNLNFSLPKFFPKPDFLFVNEEPFFYATPVVESLLRAVDIWQPFMVYWLWYHPPRRILEKIRADLQQRYHVRYCESAYPDPALFPISQQQFLRGPEGYVAILAHR